MTEDVFYILWNPNAPWPPKVRFYSYAEAELSARLMAEKHSGRFYICAAASCAEALPGPVSVVFTNIDKAIAEAKSMPAKPKKRAVPMRRNSILRGSKPVGRGGKK